MIRTTPAFLLSSAAACLAAPSLPGATTAPRAIVVSHAALWTPDGVRADHEIVVRDGRVAATGPSGTLERPAGARVIDAAGDTLLPGLIDAHVHLVSGVRVPESFSADARARVAAKQLLRSGVTTARIHLWDLATAAAFRRESAGAGFPGPRLQAGGPGLLGGRPEWNAENGNVWGVAGIDDAREKVRRMHGAGVDWVALHDLGRFQPGELDAIVAEARRLGLRLIAGGDRIEEAALAVAAGVDSVEYTDRGEAQAYPDEFMARARERGASLFFLPIIGFPHRFLAYREGRMELDAPRLTEFMPEEVAAFAATALREDQTREIPWAPTWLDKLPLAAKKFRQLHAAGLQLVAGSDCGSPAHIQADAIWWELETWRQLGVPVDAVIRGATVLPAALLRDPAAGHLAPGAHGDFVVYRGRLDDGPLAVDRVRAVSKGGVVFVDEGAWCSGGDT